MGFCVLCATVMCLLKTYSPVQLTVVKRQGGDKIDVLFPTMKKREQSCFSNNKTVLVVLIKLLSWHLRTPRMHRRRKGQQGLEEL